MTEPDLRPLALVTGRFRRDRRRRGAGPRPRPRPPPRRSQPVRAAGARLRAAGRAALAGEPHRLAGGGRGRRGHHPARRAGALGRGGAARHRRRHLRRHLAAAVRGERGGRGRADPAGAARPARRPRPGDPGQLRRRAEREPGVGVLRGEQVRAAGLRRRAPRRGGGPTVCASPRCSRGGPTRRCSATSSARRAGSPPGALPAGRVGRGRRAARGDGPRRRRPDRAGPPPRRPRRRVSVSEAASLRFHDGESRQRTRPGRVWRDGNRDTVCRKWRLAVARMETRRRESGADHGGGSGRGAPPRGG